MQPWRLAILVGIPLGWHVALTAFVYYDAGRVGFDPEKWAAIAFLVPIFGLFAYLFERSELSYDPESDPYRRGGFNVHPSRADDTVLPTGERDDDSAPEETGEAESPSKTERTGDDDPWS